MVFDDGLSKSIHKWMVNPSQAKMPAAGAGIDMRC